MLKFLLNDTQRIKFWAIAFLLSMPLGGHVSNLILVLLSIDSLQFFIRQPHSIKKAFMPINSWLMSGFALYLIGMLYTDDRNEGWFQVQQRLLFLLLPLLFALHVNIWKSIRERMLTAFMFGNFLAAIFCWMKGFYVFWNGLYCEANIKGFPVYSDFSKCLHPTYASVYLLIAMGILLIQHKKRPNWMAVTGFIFLLVTLFVYSSKAALLAAFPVIVFLVLNRMAKKWRWKVGVLILLAFIALFIFNPRVHKLQGMIKEMLTHQKVDTTVSSDDSNAQRTMTWKTAWQLFQQSPWTGHGTGDSRNLSVEIYKAQHLDVLVEKRLNAHNQYLEEGVKFGIWGPLWLLIGFSLAIYRGIKRRNKLLLIFVWLFMFNFLFESMLQTQAGIFAFGILLLLLFNGPRPETPSPSESVNK